MVLVSFFFISAIIVWENIFVFLCSVRSIFLASSHLFWYREEGSVTVPLKKHSAAKFRWFRTVNFSFLMLLITITATLYSVPLRAASTVTLQTGVCVHKNLACVRKVILNRLYLDNGWRFLKTGKYRLYFVDQFLNNTRLNFSQFPRFICYSRLNI